MENENKKDYTKENNKELTFSIVFNPNGESFQNIMDRLLINKIVNKI